MSVCAATYRRILLDIANMDGHKAEIAAKKMSSGMDEAHLAKGVKSNSTTSVPATTEVPRSIGKLMVGIVCFNGRNNQKQSAANSVKNESGSGSGDHEICQHEDGSDVGTKKRKTRRGKPKYRKLKPYSKQVTYQRQMQSRAIGRLTKTGMQPPAPYNTTQFLMNDHSDLPDLEQKLSEAVSSELPTNCKPAPPRTRDSSFSVDSDEDYFYSSPEDEEEFLTKEFSSAYEDLHAERLGNLSKSELIQEYIQLEARVDLLTKRIRGKNFHQVEEWDAENKHGTTADNEISKKLKICQQRIDDLIQQNEQLRRENETLRAQRDRSSVSSVDSESDSDSDSTSNGSRSSCSCLGISPHASPKCIAHGHKRESNEKKCSSPCNTVNHSEDLANQGGQKESVTSTNFTKGHITTHEIDTSPT